jgi:hypothetical protein
MDLFELLCVFPLHAGDLVSPPLREHDCGEN